MCCSNSGFLPFLLEFCYHLFICLLIPELNPGQLPSLQPLKSPLKLFFFFFYLLALFPRGSHCVCIASCPTKAWSKVGLKEWQARKASPLCLWFFGCRLGKALCCAFLQVLTLPRYVENFTKPARIVLLLCSLSTWLACRFPRTMLKP